MAGATYNGCTCEGGFQGMKPSGEARLIVTGNQFVLRRPRVFFSPASTSSGRNGPP